MLSGDSGLRGPRLDTNVQAELEDQVQISTSFEDLCDQNVIVYLLRTKSKEYMPQVACSSSAQLQLSWIQKFHIQ